MTEHASVIRDCDPSPAHYRVRETKIEGFVEIFGEDVEQRREENERREERGRAFGDMIKAISESQTRGRTSEEQKIPNVGLGGRIEAPEPGARREGGERSRSGLSGERAHVREGLRPCNRGKLVERAGMERPAFSGTTRAAAIKHHGEIRQRIPYETKDHCRPYHVKVPPTVFKDNSRESCWTKTTFIWVMKQ